MSVSWDAIGSWVGSSLTPGIIGALAGSAITGWVSMRISRDSLNREDAREAARRNASAESEWREFQRENILGIQENVWKAVMIAVAMQGVAREIADLRPRNAEEKAQADRIVARQLELLRLKTAEAISLEHQLETMHARIEDRAIAERLKVILDMGADILRAAPDTNPRDPEQQQAFDEKISQMHEHYNQYRTEFAGQLKALYLDH